MKKIYIVGVVLIVVAWFLVVYFYVRVPKVEAPTEATVSTSTAAVQTPVTEPVDGYKNTSYQIEGKVVTLIHGAAETSSAPGSTSVNLTNYFGNEVRTDLNGDGKEDVVFLLTHQTGGTGVFYYVVAALKTDAGYKGSEALFIGDRIAPQTTEVKDGIITINYADRKAGASFAEPPTEGKSMQVRFDVPHMKFIAVTKEPTVSWTFEKSGDQDLSPQNKVTLTFNGKNIEVGTYAGLCVPLEAPVGDSGLLPGEVSGVLCWWAGGGDEIGVFKEGDGYVVKVGAQDEGDAQSAGFRGDFKTLMKL
jgi:hypothetical protein